MAIQKYLLTILAALVLVPLFIGVYPFHAN